MVMIFGWMDGWLMSRYGNDIWMDGWMMSMIMVMIFG